jgi:hypothetical protein
MKDVHRPRWADTLTPRKESWKARQEDEENKEILDIELFVT